MARAAIPGSAFQKQCNAAANRVKAFLATSLRNDMRRMLEEELHSDMVLDFGHLNRVSLHSCILKARYKMLYELVMSLSCNNTRCIAIKKDCVNQKLKDLVCELYTNEDVSKTAADLEHYLRPLEHLNGDENEMSNKEFQLGADSVTVTEYSSDHIHGCMDIESKYCSLSDMATHISHGIVEEALGDVGSTVTGTESSALNWPIHEQDYFYNDEERDPRIPDVNASIIDHTNTNDTCAHPADNVNIDIQIDGRNQYASSDKETERGTVVQLDVFGVNSMVQCCSHLATDLLRMLCEQIDCDCVIRVSGHEFPAHRCILSARSSYFAAMLGGSWRESDKGEIVLQGIDASVMRQFLLYLYGGVIDIASSCDLGGLVSLADMYGLDGLKAVVMFNLNVKYCHFFHRPCHGCMTGVLEAFTVLLKYNIVEFRDCCVKWINTHFKTIWPTKAFALLPLEVLELFAINAVKNLALDNVIDILTECQQMNETLPKLKWAEPIFDMIINLKEAAIEFSSENFVKLVASNTFKDMDKKRFSFNNKSLYDIFGMIITTLSPGNTCHAYLALDKWVENFKNTEDEQRYVPYSEEFMDFVGFLLKKCKEFLCQYIHQAINTSEWCLLSIDMQRALMEDANYVLIDDPNKGRMARPTLTSMQKIPSTSSLSLKKYLDFHFGDPRPYDQPIRESKSQLSKRSALAETVAGSHKQTKARTSMVKRASGVEKHLNVDHHSDVRPKDKTRSNVLDSSKRIGIGNKTVANRGKSAFSRKKQHKVANEIGSVEDKTISTLQTKGRFQDQECRCFPDHLNLSSFGKSITRETIETTSMKCLDSLQCAANEIFCETSSTFDKGLVIPDSCMTEQINVAQYKIADFEHITDMDACQLVDFPVAGLEHEEKLTPIFDVVFTVPDI